MKKRSTRARAEDKTHKHSRRKRKSSSEESDNGEAEVKNDQTEETKTRRGTRKTDKEPENNTAAMGRVTRNSRRLAAINASVEEVKESTPEIQSPVKTGKSSPFSGSPNKDRKKAGTPDKHKPKDEGWKIASANGSGSGGIQKLKICRQRSPQPESSNEIGADAEVESVGNLEVNENNADTSSGNDIQHSALPDEDVASIQLPQSEPVESIQLPQDEPPLTKPIKQGQLVPLENISKPSKENAMSVGSIIVENIELPPGPQTQPGAQSKSEIVQSDKQLCKIEKLETVKVMQVEYVAVQYGEAEVQMKPNENEIVGASNVPEAITVSELPKESVFSPQTEQDDGFQAELVLTVEDGEEPSGLTSEFDHEQDSKENEKSKTLVLSSISQVEMEEVYDYEHDDTKEEGELSGNEALSPIHEVFKKLPADERKRNWGSCNIFLFNRSNTIVNEEILKSHNILKKVLNKDELDSSDNEDLIFVNEIREENIVHEIESETNNTSLTERDVSPSVGNSQSQRHKKTLESDKIRPSKRHSKESRTANAEGRTVLYIRNLVRPFTLAQLKELLQRTGKIVEDGIWLDSIKSKCYVQFENEDQAVETRQALHGIKWPVNNPKNLHVQFATVDDLIAAQVHTNELEIPRKTEPLVISNHNNDPSQRKLDLTKHLDQYAERPRKLRDVREWDIGKPAHPDEMTYADADDFNKKVEAEPVDRNRRDRKRRNETPDDDLRVKRHRKIAAETKPPVESKQLDDLFRRTKATPNSPSIYWLPLTEEQIAAKQEARRKRLEDKQLKKENDPDREPRGRDRERRRSRR